MKVFYILLFVLFCHHIFAQTAGTKKWDFKTDTRGRFDSSPAISSEGTIYIGSTDGTLYAINSDSTKKWEYTTGGAIESSPAIGPDGSIYVNSTDGKLYALFPDGIKKWVFEVGTELKSSPAVSSDGTIYSASNAYPNSTLYAINSDGTEKWHFNIESRIKYSPTISVDGTVYISIPIYIKHRYLGCKLYAINSEGQKKWEFEIKRGINSPPIIGSNGTIYITNGYLEAINPDGTLKWIFSEQANFYNPPSIGSDGTLYLGASNGKIYAINPDGTKKWKSKITDGFKSSPVIGSDGTIYIGSSSENKFFAINPDGTIKWEYTTSYSIQSSPAIASDGTIYFGSKYYNSFGILYALYSESSGLANSPWPKYRKNNRNQGSAFNSKCPRAKIVNRSFNVRPNTNLTLDGSLSYDPDGDPLKYSWKVLKNTSSHSLILSDSTSAIIDVTPFHGSYVLSLTVTDNEDGFSTDVVEINAENKWVYPIYGSAKSSPSIGLDGTIYIGTSDYHGNLYAIGSDGTKKWELETKGTIQSSPAIGTDGTVYVGTSDKYIYAVSSDGSIKWKFETGDSICSSPIIGYQGTIYVGSNDHNLYAINPDGTKKWVFKTQGIIKSSPSMGTDGTIYFGSYDQKLYAINPDGTQKWFFNTANYIRSSPALDLNGTIYFGSGDGKLYALNPDGTLKWDFQTGNEIECSPVIGNDGTIYIGSNDSIFYAINPDGTKKWEFKTEGEIVSTALIGRNGVIYFGSTDHNFYALNPDGTIKWKFDAGNPIESSPAIGTDGTIYLGTLKTDYEHPGKIFALWSESGGIADSPWPKFMKNNQHISYFNFNSPVAKVKKKNISTKPGIVTLDATPSFDPNGDPLFYLWRIIEKPVNSTIKLSDSTSAVINVEIPRGIFKISVTVTDNKDGASSEIITVDAEKKWEFETNKENCYQLGFTGIKIPSLAIGSDGIIYVNSYVCKINHSNYDWNWRFYAINPDGTKKWEFENDKRDNYSVSPPVVASDGTIYLSMNSDKKDDHVYTHSRLCALNPDGTLKWEFRTINGINSSPAIDPEGIVYFSDYNKLYAINPDGTKKWEFNTKNCYGFSTPVISLDGTVYVCSDDNKLYAFDPEGTKKWEFEFGGDIGSAPAIDSDGTLYLGTKDHYVYAIKPDGALKWKFKTGGGIQSSAAIGPDGTIYIGSDDHKLYAINPDGTKRWTFEAQDKIRSSVAIGSDSTIYFGSNDHKFYAVNPDSTKKWEFITGGAISTSPVIAKDGTIYFGSNDGKIYAVYSESHGLANSLWPRFMNNNQNNRFYNKYCPRAIIPEEHIASKSGYIRLNGSQSYDPDGDNLHYLWKVIEQPENTNIVLNDSTSPEISANLPRGSYKISLTVTDNEDGTSTDIVTVSTELKWEFTPDHAITSSPAIGVDGTIYCTDYQKLYAIKPDGTKKWEFEANDDIKTSPSIAPEGTVYIAEAQKLYAINPDGTEKWEFNSKGIAYQAYPSISSKGTVYISFCSEDYSENKYTTLYAINPDGRKEWEFRFGGWLKDSSPAIASDGTIYFGSTDNRLYALNVDGTKKWDAFFPVDYCYKFPIVMGFDGTIYAKLYAFNPNGTKKWGKGGGGNESFPAIGLDGIIYVVSSYSYFMALNSDGNKIWGNGHFKYNDDNSPLIGSDGTIYVSGYHGSLYAFNPDGSIKWQFKRDNDFLDSKSPAMGSDGTIYFASDKLYAIYSQSAGLANSPWPKFGGNNQNSGQVLKTTTSLAVYPGDTDNDGHVNEYDILPIGIYFMNQGFKRDSSSYRWQAQKALSWDVPQMAFADANGDGIINEQDILAIGINWGKSREEIDSTQIYKVNLDGTNVRGKHLSSFKKIYYSLSGNSADVIKIKKLLATILDINIPKEYKLFQNYPNPFNNSTTFHFALPKESIITIEIYDILGRIVSIPIKNKLLKAGNHIFRYKANNLSTGIYFYVIKTKHWSDMHKMLLIK